MIKKIFWSIFLLSAAFFGGGFLGMMANTNAAANEVEIVLRENCGKETCPDLPIHNNDFFKFSRFPNVGERISFQVIVKNPAQNAVYSVASWIKYNPAIFGIENLSAEKSDLALSAPNEFETDSKTGELKIGRATTGMAVSKPEIVVAHFDVVIKQSPKNSTLSFMDFQVSGGGKTSVLTLDNFVPRNLLSKAPKNLIFVSTGNIGNSGNSGNSGSSTNTGNTNAYIPATQNGLYQNINGTNVSQSGTGVGGNAVLFESANAGVAIPRPDGFRARTYSDGRTEFLWKAGEDVRINGYYLYYSLSSGRYMHRRDVGKTNNFALPADFFEKGKRVFFAIQAYDAFGKISDFSDEAYVIVGTSGSESHPFFEQIFPNGVAPSVNPPNPPNYQSGNGLSANLSGNSGVIKTNGKTPESGISENFFFLFFGTALLLFATRQRFWG